MCPFFYSFKFTFYPSPISKFTRLLALGHFATAHSPSPSPCWRYIIFQKKSESRRLIAEQSVTRVCHNCSCRLPSHFHSNTMCYIHLLDCIFNVARIFWADFNMRHKWNVNVMLHFVTNTSVAFSNRYISIYKNFAEIVGVSSWIMNLSYQNQFKQETVRNWGLMKMGSNSNPSFCVFSFVFVWLSLTITPPHPPPPFLSPYPGPSTLPFLTHTSPLPLYPYIAFPHATHTATPIKPKDFYSEHPLKRESHFE